MSFFNYDLNSIVRQDHALRSVDKIISFARLAEDFRGLEKETGRPGFGVELGLRALFLQFFYDLSDREMEERLRYDVSFKWFCKVSFDGETPDHTFFCRMRQTLGTQGVSKIFKSITTRAERKGVLRKVFTFVDSSAVKAKEATWSERDKALSDGEEKLDNRNVSTYGADKDARFGCKGKDKFWYGYKRHASVDMGSGLIKDIAATPANVPDGAGLEAVCPDGGMVFCDKAYCMKRAREAMSKRGCHSGAILKNNMKGKNRDKDRWLTKMRAPFENVFSKMAKRTKYRGLAKMNFQAVMEAITFNARRLVAIGAGPLWAGA